MIATEEPIVHHYRGVLCGYCRQPIPLPGIVERSASTEVESAPEKAIHAFHLRCRVCEREKTYRLGDVAEFEGAPRPRSVRAHRSFVKSARIARAAHG
jgi:hypothetical protein